MLTMTLKMMRLERDVISPSVDRTKSWQDVIGSSPDQSAYKKWGTCEYLHDVHNCCPLIG
jgi:hypothetical protein